MRPLTCRTMTVSILSSPVIGFSHLELLDDAGRQTLRHTQEILHDLTPLVVTRRQRRPPVQIRKAVELGNEPELRGTERILGDEDLDVEPFAAPVCERAAQYRLHLARITTRIKRLDVPHVALRSAEAKEPCLSPPVASRPHRPGRGRRRCCLHRPR